MEKREREKEKKSQHTTWNKQVQYFFIITSWTSPRPRGCKQPDDPSPQFHKNKKNCAPQNAGQLPNNKQKQKHTMREQDRDSGSSTATGVITQMHTNLEKNPPLPTLSRLIPPSNRARSQPGHCRQDRKVAAIVYNAHLTVSSKRCRQLQRKVETNTQMSFKTTDNV